ncbi:PfkB family carbohydrate kinase [Thermotoga sp. KOL6]|uniref:PfkB family carbohydrate kinase n=1 Tax=Thermotoga sp. KOL6 TaxID=126741 RepID=UPI000C77071D|nr:PfkB family carbohydrate kinase [Thermotoga sp. KOL6]PLV59490.1 carbohydrate kinase [Thermotoga sp. KOL6]
MRIAVVGGSFWDIFVFGKEAHSVLIKETPGGSGLNVAYGLFLLGYEVDFFSNIGNDYRGKHIIKVLNDEGFDISGIEIVRGEKTGLFIAFNDRPLAVDRGVNEKEVDVPSPLDDYDLIFITGEVPEETIKTVCEEGSNVVLDIGPNAKVDTENLKALVIGNEEECSKTRCDIVKMGPKGARWGRVEIPGNGRPFPYSLGLGDVFDVVLIHLLLKGKSQGEALKETVEYVQDFYGKEPKTPFEKISDIRFLEPFDKTIED